MRSFFGQAGRLDGQFAQRLAGGLFDHHLGGRGLFHRHLAGPGFVRRRLAGRGLFHCILFEADLHLQGVVFAVGQRPVPTDDLGLDAAAGDVRPVHFLEILAADDDLERGAAATAGGEDVSDVRVVRGGLCREPGASRQEEGKRKEAGPSRENHWRSSVFSVQCSVFSFQI